MSNKPSRKCRKCGKRKPLTAEYFRRDRNAPKNYQVRCKICSSEAIKSHYRSWTKADIDERGETGVRCILYSSEICQVCPCPSITELEKCVRLTETSPEYDDYPDLLPQ